MGDAKETVGGRIRRMIDELEGGSAKRFSEKTGISKSSVSKLMSGSCGIGSRGIGPYFERIVDAYPQVSPVWIASGTGDMYVYVPKLRDEILERLDRIESAIREKQPE